MLLIFKKISRFFNKKRGRVCPYLHLPLPHLLFWKWVFDIVSLATCYKKALEFQAIILGLKAKKCRARVNFTNILRAAFRVKVLTASFLHSTIRLILSLVNVIIRLMWSHYQKPFTKANAQKQLVFVDFRLMLSLSVWPQSYQIKGPPLYVKSNQANNHL